jgi:hypothetical protein
MIAAIIDIVASRDVSTQKRKKMFEEIRVLLNRIYSRFEKSCVAVPSLTQGDSIELLVVHGHPIVFLFHSLLMRDIEFRVGIGTGEVTILNKDVDHCDGPAFWNARESLNRVKGAKYMSSPAGFKVDEKTSCSEKSDVMNSILFLSSLTQMNLTQLRLCYYNIWEEKNLSEIAEIVGTTKGSVSRSLSVTPCYLLGKVLSFLDEGSN